MHLARTRHLARGTTLAVALASLTAPPTLASPPTARPPARQARQEHTGVHDASAHEAALLRELRAAGGGRTRIAREPGTGQVTLVGLPPVTSLADAQGTRSTAHAFVARYAVLFGASPTDLTAVSIQPVGQGSLVTFQQHHADVPVHAARLKIRMDGHGRVLTAVGRLTHGPAVDPAPTLSAGTARRSARSSVSALWDQPTAQVTVGPATLTVYDPVLLGRPGALGDAPTTRPSLAWRVRARGTGDAPRLADVFVEAHDARILHHLSLAAPALYRRVCDNAHDRAAPATCTEPVRKEGDPPAGDAQVQEVYEQLGAVHDFFLTRLGRDGLDGRGGPLNAVVRYCRPDPRDACPSRNAYWDGTETMLFGDGYTVDDITGHELTHGITQATSGLVYQDQSGAINESMSDVFGELVDLTNGLGDDSPQVRWLVGEELPNGTLRDMANPSRYGDPDSMTSETYRTVPQDEPCQERTNDYCWVHANSGVGNKAAALIVDGGELHGHTVTGIGVSKAARLYYETQLLLVPTSRYLDLAHVLVQACTNLTTERILAPDDCTQVGAAVAATRMDQPPHQGDATGALQAVDGCTDHTLPHSDDASRLVDLPFPAYFHGTLHYGLYVNTDGNVSFGEPLNPGTPFELSTHTGTPLIAPFLADVDTTSPRSDVVTYGTSDDGTSFCVTWAGTGVGYHDAHSDKVNRFQVLLVDASGEPGGHVGDFDVVMNYGTLQWDSGDHSDGSHGLGGVPARAGYSAGTGEQGGALEITGSGAPGALLDTAPTGLVHGSHGSTQPGRYVFPVRSADGPPGGSLTGHVSRTDSDSPSGTGGLTVQVCPAVPEEDPCPRVVTNPAGRYRIAGLPEGTHLVTVHSPGGSAALPVTSAPLPVRDGVDLRVDDLVLTDPLPLPGDTDITHLRVEQGVPVLDANRPLDLTVRRCPGADAAWELSTGGTVTRSGRLRESPAGTYTTALTPLAPLHGPAEVSLTLTCPGQDSTRTTFTVDIDTPALVVDTDGLPLPGVSLTLLTASDGRGDFEPVPAGSALLSPIHRDNPATSTAEGHFGWDAVSGYYKVRATKEGCSDPYDHDDDIVETGVLVVPPRAGGFRVTLYCPGGVRDAVRFTRSGSTRYTFGGTLSGGDFIVSTTAGGHPRRIRGDGLDAEGGHRITVSLRISRNRNATGTIAVTNTSTRAVDTVRLRKSKVTVNGTTLRGVVRWTAHRRSQELTWRIRDLRR